MDLSMTVIKPGDLVVLKSGGPTMTVDTVNTDIFDDDKVTGILCVWFVGDKLERVRFDHRAIERLNPAEGDRPEEATGDYKIVLDEMVAAMNIPADTERDAAKAVARPRKPLPKSREKAAALPVSDGVGSIP